MGSQLATSVLLQELQSKIDYLGKRIEQTTSIVKNDGSAFSSAFNILNKYMPIEFSAMEGMVTQVEGKFGELEAKFGQLESMFNQLPDKFDQLFSAESLLRLIPDMGLFGIGQSGQAASSHGDWMLSSLNDLEGCMLALIAAPNYDFIASNSTVLVDTVKSTLARMMAGNLNYGIPVILLGEYTLKVQNLKASLYDPTLFFDLWRSPMALRLDDVDFARYMYNAKLDIHVSNLDNFFSSESATRKRMALYYNYYLAGEIHDAILSLDTEKFPYTSKNAIRYGRIYEMVDSLDTNLFTVFTPTEEDFDIAFPEVRVDFEAKSGSLIKVRDEDVQSVMRSVQVALSGFFGAASQAYNLEDKETRIKAALTEGVGSLELIKATLSFNGPNLNYSFDSNIVSDMQEFIGAVNGQGMDYFASALKSADWGTLDSITKTGTTLFGAMAEQIGTGTQALTMVEQQIKTQLTSLANSKLLSGKTYSSSVKEMKDWLVKEQGRLTRLKEAYQKAAVTR